MLMVQGPNSFATLPRHHFHGKLAVVKKNKHVLAFSISGGGQLCTQGTPEKPKSRSDISVLHLEVYGHGSTGARVSVFHLNGPSRSLP